MPIFAVLLEDEPEQAAAIRRRHMEAHLAFLDRHRATIRAAGPLQDAASGEAAGGLRVGAGGQRRAGGRLDTRRSLLAGGIAPVRANSRMAAGLCGWRSPRSLLAVTGAQAAHRRSR